MEIELKILEEGSKVKIHLDAHQVTLKKYLTYKPQALIAFTDLVLKIHLNPRQTGYQNE